MNGHGQSSDRRFFSPSLTVAAAHIPIFLLIFILAAGCGGKEESIDPSRLGPDETAVVSVSPLSGEVGLDSPIGLVFSAPLAPEGEPDGIYLETPPASIEPEIPGVWRWATPYRLEFVPDRRYDPGAEYTLRVDRKIGARSGRRLTGPDSFRFVAERFRVVDTRLFRERLPEGERQYLVRGTVTFNLPVDPDQCAPRLSAAMGDGKSVDLIVETEEPSEQISFRAGPIGAAEKDRRFDLTVDGGLTPFETDRPLGEKVTETIQIPAFDRLAVESMSYEQTDQRKAVRIRFSSTVDADQLKRALRIEPTLSPLAVSPSGRSVLLLGEWEYGKRYELTLSGDLASVEGYELEREFRGSVFVGDLEPVLEIAGRGSYLSLKGERKIAVETVNLEKFNIEVDRIHANNLVHFFHRTGLGGGYRYSWYELEEFGENIYRRDREVTSKIRNEKVITPIDLDGILTDDSKGVFRLTLRKTDERRETDRRFIIATDIGLVAKRSGGELHIFALSIDRLEPLAGVDVSVRSRNNQILAEAVTDGDGMARFVDLPEGIEGSEPFLILAERGDDLSFLAFKDTRLPTGDLDVGGHDHPDGGYEAFLYSDRGIFRPGDRARIAWIVRDSRRQAPPEFPLILRVSGPDGKEFQRARVTTGEWGTGEFTLEIPDWAPTGIYNVLLRIDEKTVLGRLDLKVEDFMPDRMKVECDLLVNGERRERARPGEPLRATAKATSLFGPPAAGRHATAKLRLTPEPVSFDRWGGYRFGEEKEGADFTETDLGGKTTDSEGIATWEIALPDIGEYHGWLEAGVEIEVTELGGGRAIGARRSVILSPVSHLVGLRRNVAADGSDYAEPGEPISFGALVVDIDGNPAEADDGLLKVFRRRWQTTLRRDDRGRYRYISEYDEILVDQRPVSLVAGPNNLDLTVDTHGEYRLQIETPGRGARGSLVFYVYGWGYSPWAMSNPERVTIKLDKELYAAGDRVQAEIEAPFEGLLLLALEREKVFHYRWVRMNSNSAAVTVDLPPDALPNVYLTATLFRPLQSLEKQAPARAFGASPVFLDRASSAIDVELDAPGEMRPNGELAVRFRLGGLPDGGTGRVTLAAVDEGILQITDFETPSPAKYFFRRRRLGVESFDIWSLLLPEYERIDGNSSPGGGEGVRRKNLNPISVKRVKPVALWSGIVEGSSEWITVRFDVPRFNGALRVMAVASTDDRFGSAESLIRVRDPIVLTPNLPRFLAPGDEFVLPVQVFNGIGGKGGASLPIDVALALTGPVDVVADDEQQNRITLPGETEGVVYLRARAAAGVGKAEFEFTGSGGGEKVATGAEMAVRPPWPLESVVAAGVVHQGGSAEIRVSDRWYAGTDRVTIALSKLPVASFAASIPYLLRYPYGCAEQTVSRCMPLLFFSDMASRLTPDLFGEGDADYFVHSGIDKLAALWVPERGFAYWPGRSSVPDNPWSSVYATHFLVEASRAGYAVPHELLDGALDNAARIARSSGRWWVRGWDDWERLSARAYATYVLALAGRPERGAMDYLSRNELDGMTLGARAHLAGAYGHAGNRAKMDAILPAGVSAGDDTSFRTTGRTWYSAARDYAIHLEVVAGVDPDHPHLPALLERLGAMAEGGRWTNTQENAFALLGLGKVVRGGETDYAKGRVLLDGEEIGRFGEGEEEVVLRGEGWSGRTIEIVADGPGLAHYSILDEGVPRSGREKPVNIGLTLSRTYLDADGNRVDPDRIRQGQVIVCRIALSSERGQVDDVVIADLVPAGLEIENPRLKDHATFDWVRSKRSLPVDYLDIRDDRLLLFTEATSEEREFFYGLRAVTAGDFVLPPVKAEAMYDPAVRSIRGEGRIRVVAP